MKSEQGFGLVEVLIAMVVLQVGLLAVIGAFGAGSVALSNASHINTAAVLADQQMELYRSMPYDAIGLDTANAPSTGTYVADTTVCTAAQSPTCGNTGPVNNNTPDSSAWSCTSPLPSGKLSVATYFTANGVNPCAAQRTVTGTASPDGHPYEIDTYIKWGTLITGQRTAKQVSVIVRDGNNTSHQLAKEVTTFDCSTGTPSNTNC